MVSEAERKSEAEPAKDEAIVAREEAAAAREAGAIGGRRSDDVDEAERPVIEGGGGESEGVEESEKELRDAAEHGG
jgi:hypothetical protein